MKKRLFGIIFSFIFLSFITSNDVFAAITGSFASPKIKFREQNSFTITGLPDEEKDYTLVFFNKTENKEIGKNTIEPKYKGDNERECKYNDKSDEQILNDYTKCSYDRNSQTFTIEGAVGTKDPDFPPSSSDRELEIRLLDGAGTAVMTPFSFIVEKSPIRNITINNPNAELKKGQKITLSGTGVGFIDMYGNNRDRIIVAFTMSPNIGNHSIFLNKKDGNQCSIDTQGLKAVTACLDSDGDGYYSFSLTFSVDDLPDWLSGDKDAWNDISSSIEVHMSYNPAEGGFYPYADQQVTLTIGSTIPKVVDFQVEVIPTPPLDPGTDFDLKITPLSGKEDNFKYSRKYTYRFLHEPATFKERTCEPAPECTIDGMKVPEGAGLESVTVVIQCVDGPGCTDNPNNTVEVKINISNIDVTPEPTPTPTPARPPCKKGVSFGQDFTDKSEGVDDPNLIDQCTEFDSGLGIIPIDVKGFVEKLFAFILGIAGGIALIILIYSGYQIMTSQGNAEKLQASKDRITSAFIGIVFIIFSLVILEVIGVDILNVPGFSG